MISYGTCISAAGGLVGQSGPLGRAGEDGSPGPIHDIPGV